MPTPTTFRPIDLERYMRGEAPPELCQQIEEDTEAMAYIQRVQAHDTMWLQANPAQRTIAAIDTESTTPSMTGWLRHLRARPIIPAIAMVMLVAGISLQVMGTDPTPLNSELVGTMSTSPDRAKGSGGSLHLYRQSSHGPESLNTGTTAQAGDVLQLSITLAQDTHALLFSLDGNQQMTLHWPSSATPENGNQAAITETNKLNAGKHTLPYAYALDDAPHFEKFVLITSPDPINISSTMQAYKATESVETTLKVETILLRKGS